jgi:hypothetical protein
MTPFTVSHLPPASDLGHSADLGPNKAFERGTGPEHRPRSVSQPLGYACQITVPRRVRDSNEADTDGVIAAHPSRGAQRRCRPGPQNCPVTSPTYEADDNFCELAFPEKCARSVTDASRLGACETPTPPPQRHASDSPVWAEPRDTPAGQAVTLPGMPGTLAPSPPQARPPPRRALSPTHTSVAGGPLDLIRRRPIDPVLPHRPATGAPSSSLGSWERRSSSQPDYRWTTLGRGCPR